MQTEASIVTVDRSQVLAELVCRPLLIAGKITCSLMPATASVLISPRQDGVQLFSTDGVVALRIVAEGVAERRVEVPGKALAVASRKLNEAEFCSIVQGPDRGLGLCFYSEKETLAVRCLEGIEGLDDGSIDTVMGALDSEREDRATAQISRTFLAKALQSLAPIASLSFRQKAKGIAIGFRADDFSGTLLCMGLRTAQD